MQVFPSYYEHFVNQSKIDQFTNGYNLLLFETYLIHFLKSISSQLDKEVFDEEEIRRKNIQLILKIRNTPIKQGAHSHPGEVTNELIA